MSGKSKRKSRARRRGRKEQHATRSDEGVLRSGRFLRIGIGSQTYVDRAADLLRANGLEVKSKCEDSKAASNLLAHKRHFLWVRADQESEATALLDAGPEGLPPGEGPPYLWGLCSTHPRWTLPCPDCFRY